MLVRHWWEDVEEGQERQGPRVERGEQIRIARACSDLPRPLYASTASMLPPLSSRDLRNVPRSSDDRLQRLPPPVSHNYRLLPGRDGRANEALSSLGIGAPPSGVERPLPSFSLGASSMAGVELARGPNSASIHSVVTSVGSSVSSYVRIKR